MKSRASAQRVNKRDICLYALVDAGGDVEFVTTEDVAVKTFEIYPERFGLIGYPHFPDVDSVRVTLTDLRKEKHGSLVEGSRRRGWRVTSSGARWMAVNRRKVSAAIRHKLSGERRISSGQLLTTEKVRSARLNRILGSDAFRKWKRGVRPSVYDFYELLRIDNYTPQGVYREHLKGILEVAPDKSEVKAFLKELAKVYGGNYRDNA